MLEYLLRPMGCRAEAPQSKRASRAVHHVLSIGVLALAVVCPAKAVEENLDPEAASGRAAKPLVQADQFMVVAADPRAVEAGVQVLEAGGTALDAAVAVQMVLGLVEPQSSGIGGGAFLLYWDQAEGRLYTYDGRETAPSAATPALFLHADGTPMQFFEALVGGRSVGTPGVLKMLELAHQAHGKRPWAGLFDPAIQLAETGFIVSPRLATLLRLGINPGLQRPGAANQYFFRDGEAVAAGTRLRNPAYAATLRRVATAGTSAFYSGATAQAIVERVRNDADNPGLLTEQDLANYEARVRDPVCAPFRSYRLCGMGPPSSGPITVLQMLAILESEGLDNQGPLTLEGVHAFTQAGRLAFADRNHYLGDADFVDVPVARLLDRAYLNERAALIDRDADMGLADPGRLPGVAPADGGTAEFPSTSHISIVDAAGNAVSMTTSIEMAFGSSLWVEGFLLNNQLTDFAFLPEQNGHPVANRVQGGKRPRSSMAPMMVFDDAGKLRAVVGSPGGSRIIPYVAQTLLGLIAWELDPQAAVALPHYDNRNGVTTLEADTVAVALRADLERLGHQVVIKDLNSGLHVIQLTPAGKLRGGADPRREGIARGR